jgi:hypothetical protein
MLNKLVTIDLALHVLERKLIQIRKVRRAASNNNDAQGGIKNFISLIPHNSLMYSVTLGSCIYSI